MATHQTALKGAMEIEGALGVALVDSGSGMALGTAGSPMDLDLDVAAAGNSNVVQAKLRTMADLGLQQSIEDILITLDKQYHIIRPAGPAGGILPLPGARPGPGESRHGAFPPGEHREGSQDLTRSRRHDERVPRGNAAGMRRAHGVARE